MSIPNILPNFDLALLDKYKKIYVLVSGGIDSTYLYELMKERFGNRVYPVNCWNPYERNHTLELIKANDKNFIEIKPLAELDYREILEKAFCKIPKAMELKKQKKYHKKIFGCCSVIKHKAFLKDPLFCEEGTVVISGIKPRDGSQRRLWLLSLKNGLTYSKNTKIEDAPTFFHLHRGGQLYCYPYRDFPTKDLPDDVLDILRKKYPDLKHSGCAVCPVLVLFKDRNKKEPRLEPSLKFWKYIQEKYNIQKIYFKELADSIRNNGGNCMEINTEEYEFNSKQKFREFIEKSANAKYVATKNEFIWIFILL